MVMEGQQGSPDAAFASVPSEEEADLHEDHGGGESRTLPHGFDCVSETTSLVDKLSKDDEDSLTGPPPLEEQQLFDPLQAVVSSCELPEQRTPLEASQVRF